MNIFQQIRNLWCNLKKCCKQVELKADKRGIGPLDNTEYLAGYGYNSQGILKDLYYYKLAIPLTSSSSNGTHTLGLPVSPSELISVRVDIALEGMLYFGSASGQIESLPADGIEYFFDTNSNQLVVEWNTTNADYTFYAEVYYLKN